MHARIVELMEKGVRRSRAECLADPGMIGTLTVGDIPNGSAEKRPLHAAQLWERWGTWARRGSQVSTKNGAGTAWLLSRHAGCWQSSRLHSDFYSQNLWMSGCVFLQTPCPA